VLGYSSSRELCSTTKKEYKFLKPSCTNGVYCRLLHAQTLASSDSDEVGDVFKEPEVVSAKEVTPHIQVLDGPCVDLPISLDSKGIRRRVNHFQCVFTILKDTKSVLPALFGGAIGACVARAAIPV
jgi:hypothetical protein